MRLHVILQNSLTPIKVGTERQVPGKGRKAGKAGVHPRREVAQHRALSTGRANVHPSGQMARHQAPGNADVHPGPATKENIQKARAPHTQNKHENPDHCCRRLARPCTPPARPLRAPCAPPARPLRAPCAPLARPLHNFPPAWHGARAQQKKQRTLLHSFVSKWRCEDVPCSNNFPKKASGRCGRGGERARWRR